jgi:hypothetical protein
MLTSGYLSFLISAAMTYEIAQTAINYINIYHYSQVIRTFLEGIKKRWIEVR